MGFIKVLLVTAIMIQTCSRARRWASSADPLKWNMICSLVNWYKWIIKTKHALSSWQLSTTTPRSMISWCRRVTPSKILKMRKWVFRIFWMSLKSQWCNRWMLWTSSRNYKRSKNRTTLKSLWQTTLTATLNFRMKRPRMTWTTQELNRSQFQTRLMKLLGKAPPLMTLSKTKSLTRRCKQNPPALIWLLLQKRGKARTLPNKSCKSYQKMKSGLSKILLTSRSSRSWFQILPSNSTLNLMTSKSGQFTGLSKVIVSWWPLTPLLERPLSLSMQSHCQGDTWQKQFTLRQSNRCPIKNTETSNLSLVMLVSWLVMCNSTVTPPAWSWPLKFYRQCSTMGSRRYKTLNGLFLTRSITSTTLREALFGKKS